MILQNFSPKTLTEANRRVNLPALVAHDVELREVAPGELRGACPFCNEGKDRFALFTIAKNGQQHNGRFSCRICGAHGDGLAYLQQKTSMSFVDTVKHVMGENWQLPATAVPIAPAKKREPINRELWRERLEPMLYHALDYLLKEKDASAAAAMGWLAKRGIFEAQIGRYGLGYNPEWKNLSGDYRLPPGLILPRWDRGEGLPLAAVNVYVSKEYREAYGRRRFLRGSNVCVPFGGHLVNETTTTIWVCEGELDAVLLAAHLPDGHEAITYGGANCLPGDDMSLFDGRRVFLVFDNDAAGRVGLEKWGELLPHANVATVPTGKDITEFWQGGGKLKQWVTSFFSPMPKG